MADESAITSLGYDASKAKQGADEFAAASKKVIDANAQVEASEQRAAGVTETAATRRTRARNKAAADSSAAAAAEKAAADAVANVWSVSIDRQVEDLKKRDRFLAASARAYDPLGAAVRKAEADVARLSAIIEAGVLSDEKAAQATATLAGAKRKLADAQQAVAASLGTGAGAAPGVGDAYAKSVSGILEIQKRLNTALLGTSEAVKQAYSSSVAPIDASTAATRRNYDASLAAAKAVNDRSSVSAAYRTSVAPFAGVAQTDKQSALDAANAAKKIAEASKEAADEQAKLAASAQAYRDQINPLLPAQRQYQAGLAEINRLVAAGNLTAAERGAALGVLKANLDRATSATKEHATATGRGTVSAQQMHFAVQNLTFQINDVATSLASGISPARTFAQQAGQIVQVFQQGGGASNVISATAAAIGRLITPTNLMIAAGAGLAVGLGAAALKAIELEGRSRTLGVTLRGMGTSGLASAGDIEKSIRELRAFGIAADDALEAAQKVTRTPGINPARATGIVETGANLGAVRGSGTAAGTDELIKALQDGPEALIKIGVEFRKLEPEEIREIRRQNDLRGSVVASDQAYSLLSQRLRGAYPNSLSDSAKAWIELKNAINDFLVELSKSGAIQVVLDELKGVLKGIQDSVKEVQSVISAARSARDAVGRGIDSITSAGDRATAGATVARSDMTSALAERDRAAGGAGQVVGAARFDTSRITANTDALQQLTTVLGEASKELPAGYGLVATSGKREGSGGSLHNTGNAIDVQIVGPTGALPNKGPIGSDPGLYKDLAVAAYRANERLFPGAPLTWGGRFETSAGSGMADWMHFDRGQDRGRFGPALADIAAGSGRMWRSASDIAAGSSSALAALGPSSGSVFAQVDQTEKLQKQTTEYGKLNAAERQWADAQVYAEARLRGVAEAEALGIKGADALTFADNAARQAVEQVAIARDKASVVQDRQTAGVMKSAEAFKVSEAAGYRVAAEEQARLEVMQRGGDVANRTRQILEEQAAQALVSARQQTAAALPQIAALEKLAEATGKGTAAAHEQQLQNEAALRTQDALAKAEATRNPALIAQAKAITDVALAEGRRADAARQNTEAFGAANENRLAIKGVNLEASLTASGATTDEIRRQLDYLTIAQTLATKYAQSSDEARQAYVATSVALADAKYQLTQVQREQEKWNNLVSDLANKIDGELTSSIENLFSEDKVESWGKRVNKWLGTISSTLSSSLFIKPALGTLAGSLGFGTAAQSLGSFGSISSLLGTGGSSSGTTGGSSAVITKNADGTFSLSNLSSGASLINSATGSSGGGLFSSINAFGTKLGFSSGESAGMLPFDSLGNDVLGLSTGSSTGIFGSTTLSSALGGVGAGFGAGSLLNSLLGGNKTTGTIGSGVGSLLGTGIGSLFGTPILGGIAGGLLGGLGGLFGQTHKRANASGLSIDLATGTAGSLQSSGSAENDKTAKQIRDDLTDFTKTLQTTTKGTLSGYVNPQATDQGIKLDYNIEGYGSGTYSTKDSQDAIDTAELAIARGLTGITDNMKKVIDQVTDPTKLDAAIKFANTYDKIADAAKDAFSSIPSDLQTEGPFAKAKDDIKTTFDDIEADAKKFGLSLKPVTDALDEANKRLTKDFDRYIKDLTTAVQDPLQSLVDIEKRAGEARLKDAKEVNGNILAVNKYNALALDKIWDDSTKSIKDFQKDLKSGEDSGLTATQRLKSAQSDYDALLADVKAGKSSKFEDFVTSGKNLYSLSTTAYGQGPKTATLRKDLLAALDGVLASRSFAAGTTATPPGVILVGEQGPELIAQPGGLQVHSSREMERVISTIGAVSGPSSIANSNLSLVANSNSSTTTSESISIQNIAAALEKAVPARAFASGTIATPPGMILVGEKGPELISQAGGLRVYTNRETERIINSAAPSSALKTPGDAARASNVIDISSRLVRSVADRSFASGITATPSGMILVGERGRELIGVPSQRAFADGTEGRPSEGLLLSTPATVLPQGQAPTPGSSNSGETVTLLRDLLSEMQANTGTTRRGLYETIQALQAQLTEMQRAAPYEPTRRKVAS